MKKTVLIFGAGENQLTLIKAAKELGLKSVVIDPNMDAPGKDLAEVFEVVAPNDYETTRDVALKYKVDGIVTSQMENPLRMMAKLANELSFIFPSPETIERSRNKFLMKKAFIEHNIPCAQGILLKAGDPILPEKLTGFRFPFIIKPADAHSSRGVYRIENLSELIACEKEVRNFSSDNSVIIEEFIEGPEYSIEAITFKGETTIIQFTEKIITSYPHTVELGHIQPAELSEEQKYQIRHVVTNAIKALGIDNSATHSELKLTSHGPVVLEIGARLGGDYISSYLTIASTGVNMDKAAIQVALGEEPDIKEKELAYSQIKYLELPEGKAVKRIGNWKELLNSEGMVYANCLLKTGSKIPSITDSAKRPGFVIVKSSSKTSVMKKAEFFCSKLAEYIELN